VESCKSEGESIRSHAKAQKKLRKKDSLSRSSIMRSAPIASSLLCALAPWREVLRFHYRVIRKFSRKGAKAQKKSRKKDSLSRSSTLRSAPFASPLFGAFAPWREFLRFHYRIIRKVSRKGAKKVTQKRFTFKKLDPAIRSLCVSSFWRLCALA
jgi:hypothetical protein